MIVANLLPNKTLLQNFICNMFFYAIILNEFESEAAYGK